MPLTLLFSAVVNNRNVVYKNVIYQQCAAFIWICGISQNVHCALFMFWILVDNLSKAAIIKHDVKDLPQQLELCTPDAPVVEHWKHLAVKHISVFCIIHASNSAKVWLWQNPHNSNVLVVDGQKPQNRKWQECSLERLFTLKGSLYFCVGPTL